MQKNFSKSCYHKKRFKNKEMAQLSIRKIGATGGPRMRVYYCTNCKGFHLTSKTIKEELSQL